MGGRTILFAPVLQLDTKLSSIRRQFVELSPTLADRINLANTPPVHEPGDANKLIRTFCLFAPFYSDPVTKCTVAKYVSFSLERAEEKKVWM